MKKLFALSLLFFLSTLQADAVDYFRSNALGMKLEKIGAFRIDEYEYTLSVENINNGERRTLVSGGEQICVWILEKRHDGSYIETEIKDNEQIVREGKNGKVLKETVEQNNELTEIRTFFYDDTGLIRIEVDDPDGPLYVDRFEKTAEGHLRMVVREYSDGTSEISRFSSGEGGLSEEVHISEGSTIRYRYRDNALSVEENWEGEELVSEITYDQIQHTSRYTDYRNGTVVVKKYDDEDRVVHQVIETGDTREVWDYIYSDDKVASETKRSAGVIETWIYEYSTDGAISSYEYYKDKILRIRRIYEDEDTYIDIVMRNNKPLLKVYYDEYNQVKTEFLGDGAGLDGESAE